MDELEYNVHVERQMNLLGITDQNYKDYINQNTVKYFLERALQMHALAVSSPLRDWMSKAIIIADHLSNNNAQYYMRYGLGRRFGMVWHAYKKIIFGAHPGRTTPLEHDHQQELSQSLNVIYMNLRGILDNFAWCLLYEKEFENAQEINPMDVGLFKQRFQNFCSFKEIKDELISYTNWNKEIKERRDPVAHRIPLYIPPSFIDNEHDERQINELHARCTKKMVEHDIESMDSIFAEIDQIGTFHAVFVHDPNEGCKPIYPTLPTDMAQLIRVGAVVERCLLAK